MTAEAANPVIENIHGDEEEIGSPSRVDLRFVLLRHKSWIARFTKGGFESRPQALKLLGISRVSPHVVELLRVFAEIVQLLLKPLPAG